MFKAISLRLRREATGITMIIPLPHGVRGADVNISLLAGLLSTILISRITFEKKPPSIILASKFTGIFSDPPNHLL